MKRSHGGGRGKRVEKDSTEFYCSMPWAFARKNQRLIFSMPGVRVDFENSMVRGNCIDGRGQKLNIRVKQLKLLIDASYNTRIDYRSTNFFTHITKLHIIFLLT